MFSPQQLTHPQLKESSYAARKRAISQLSNPQTEKSPLATTPQPSEPGTYEEGRIFSDLDLLEEDNLLYDTPPYNLRKGGKKKGY